MRAPATERQERVGAEHLADSDRVGVEVEQPTAPFDSHRGVAQVFELELGVDAIVVKGEPHGTQAVREPDDAGIDVAVDVLDAGDGTVAEERQEPVRVERLADGQPDREPTSRADATPAAHVGG